MALGHWRYQEEGYPSVKHGRDFELSGTPAQLNVSKTLYDLWLGTELGTAGRGKSHGTNRWLMAIDGNRWQSMAIDGNQWQLMVIDGD